MIQDQETFDLPPEIPEVIPLLRETFKSERHIFIHELLTNASNALDKLRYKSLLDPNILLEDKRLRIEVEISPEDKYLTIRDNGIGMSKGELVQYLGYYQGTDLKQYCNALKRGEDINTLMWQGVGFLAAFIPGDEVTVRSKKIDEDEAHWKSNGVDKFYCRIKNTGMSRGTEVSIHISPGNEAYLDENVLKPLVEHHSHFIRYPIFVGKKGYVQTSENINPSMPLWKRPVADVSPEEHSVFYKALTKDWEEYLAVKHFHFEGGINLSAILFVPRKMRPTDRYTNIQLFINEISIKDYPVTLVPKQLNFVCGVIECNDFPLKVEEGVDYPILDQAKHAILKKIFELFEDIKKDEDSWRFFSESFSWKLKDAFLDHIYESDKIIDLIPISTSKRENTTLSEYVSRMPESQDAIYYLAENIFVVKNLSSLESLQNLGIELILINNDTDENIFSQLYEYNGIPVVDIRKSNVDLTISHDEIATVARQANHLCEAIRDILGTKVGAVQIYSNLSKHPMELSEEDPQVLDVNPNHPIMIALSKELQADNVGQKEVDIIWLLYETAKLRAGYSISDPETFADKLYETVCIC